MASIILTAIYQITYGHFGRYNFFWGGILILFISCLIIVVHELGHVCALKWGNTQIRSINVPFCTVDLSYNFKIKMSMNRLGEGLVIPRIKRINNELEFARLKGLYLKFLLAGPIATIIFLCISVFVLFAMKHFFKELTSYCVVLILATCFQTFFLVHNFFVISEKSVGDIAALYKVKESDFFFASYVYSCYFFQVDYKAQISKCDYIKNIIKKNITNMSDDELMQESDLLDEIIYYSICGLDNYFKDFLNQRIYSLVDCMMDRLTNQVGDGHGIISTYIHALMYIAIICKNRDKAFKLYIQQENLLHKQNDKNCDYLDSQIRYLLCLESIIPKKIYPIPEFEKWNFYEQYYDCENVLWEIKL